MLLAITDFPDTAPTNIIQNADFIHGRVMSKTANYSGEQNTTIFVGTVSFRGSFSLIGVVYKSGTNRYMNGLLTGFNHIYNIYTDTSTLKGVMTEK